jgi:hypothetical protein
MVLSVALTCLLAVTAYAQQEIKLNLKPHRETREQEQQPQQEKQQLPQEEKKQPEQEKQQSHQQTQQQTQPQQHLETAYIEWKPVPGAIKYQVEITDASRQKVLETTTEVTKLETDLPYGKYNYRVGIITKFNKPSMWTDWLELLVVPALEPAIVSVTPASIFNGIKTKITLKGKNFYRKSSVSITSGETAIPVTQVKYVDPETLVATVNTKGVSTGAYDLAVKNPGTLLKLTAVAKDRLTVTEKPPGYPLEYHLVLEVGYNSSMLGEDDAYTGSLGFNFYCEFHKIWRSTEALSFMGKAPGLYPGIVFSYFGFLRQQEHFSTSLMLQAGFFFGYQFSFPIKNIVTLNVSPVIGYKQYFRWHRYEGMDSYGTKPMLFLGGNTTVDLPRNFFIGLALEYDAIFELRPVHTIGIFVRCGYKL